MMRPSTALIIAAALVCTASAVAAGEPMRAVGAAVAKPLKAAQAFAADAHYAEALDKLREAQAIAERSAFDDSRIDELFGFVYVRMRDYPQAAFYMEAGLRSGFMNTAEVPVRIHALAQTNFLAKNYGRAIDFGRQTISDNPADEEMYVLVAQSLYKSRESAQLLQFLEPHLAQRESQGLPADKEILGMLFSASVDLNDNERAGKYLRRLSEVDPAGYGDNYVKWKRLQAAADAAAGRANDK